MLTLATPRAGAGRGPRSRRPARGPAVELAAEQRHALAHPDQAVAAGLAVGGGAAAPVVEDLQLERAGAVAHADLSRARRSACLSVLVSASWTIR